MSNTISLDKVFVNVIPEFIDTRLLPSVPSPMKFLIGGATPIVLSKAKNLIEPYVPTLKALEVIDGDNNLDIDKANVFINNGFNASGKFEYMGFIFSKDDGTAFVSLLNKYKDQ